MQSCVLDYVLAIRQAFTFQDRRGWKGGARMKEPAFPVHPDAHKCSDAECAMLSGMSLRDYFAAKAMQGLIAQSNGTALGSRPGAGAKFAYEMADAMMREREGTSSADQIAKMLGDANAEVERLKAEILRLQAIGRTKRESCDHVWGTDGMHSNVFCKKCFVSKPNSLDTPIAQEQEKC